MNQLNQCNSRNYSVISRNTNYFLFPWKCLICFFDVQMMMICNWESKKWFFFKASKKKRYPWTPSSLVHLRGALSVGKCPYVFLMLRRALIHRLLWQIALHFKKLLPTLFFNDHKVIGPSFDLSMWNKAPAEMIKHNTCCRPFYRRVLWVVSTVAN